MPTKLKTILSRLDALNLPQGAYRKVLDLVLELQTDLEERRARDRARKAKSRKKRGHVTKTAAPRGIDFDEQADFFARGKQILGKDSGGLLAKLLKNKGSVPKARAAIEQASERQDPREYIAAIVNKTAQSDENPRLL